MQGQVNEFGVASSQLKQSSKFTRIILRISGVMISVSAGALGIMMLLSLVDITGRKFMHPINGTIELVGMLLIVTASLGLGWCQLEKGNIRIDILTKRLSARGQAIMSILSYLMSLFVCVLIVWQGSKYMWEYILKDLGGRTATLGMPIWPFWLIMILGFVFVIIVFLIDLYQSFTEALKK